jgi:hypothetical protein
MELRQATDTSASGARSKSHTKGQNPNAESIAAEEGGLCWLTSGQHTPAPQAAHEEAKGS